jgi:TetR/AcrR family transcriptional repressor of nem operon
MHYRRRMARPRGFDPETTLDKAVEVFCARGWRRTSLDDLVDELGVPRQSLYNTFGDKEDLYRSALGRYIGDHACAFAKALADPRPIRVVLREMFARKVDEVLAAPEDWGCMVLSATLERPDDERTRALVRESHQRMETALSRRLEVARQAGEIGAHHDPLPLARFLLSALVGLAVVGRGRPDRQALEDVARVSLAALG